MALTNQEKDRLFNYLLRGFSTMEPRAMLHALFQTLFMSVQERQNWVVARITEIRNRTQSSRDVVDAQSAASKVALDAEIADLNTIQNNL